SAWLAWRAFSSRGYKDKEAPHGTTPLRQKVTGNTPPWWAGRDIPGQVSGETLVAGATHGAPPRVMLWYVRLVDKVLSDQATRRNSAQHLVHRFRRPFADHATIRLDDIDGPCGEVEPAYVEPTVQGTALLAHEGPQRAALRRRQLVLAASTI